MGLFRSRLVERKRDGTFTVNLGEDERALLASLPVQLAALVDAEPDDPWLRRLFPAAYPNDPELEAEWRLLMSVDLHDRRRSQLGHLASTADATSLTEEELVGWANALNDLRLYLGTRLDVTEEAEWADYADPDQPEGSDEQALYALYTWLGYLQENVIAALSDAL